MVQTRYDPAKLKYKDFFPEEEENQEGEGYARYEGIPHQRGYGQYGRGWGDIFRGFAQISEYALRKAGKEIGKEALPTAVRVLANIAKGHEAKEVLKNETKAASKRIADRYAHEEDGQSGEGSVPRKKRRISKRKSPPKKRRTRRNVRKSSFRRTASRKSLLGRKVLKAIALKNTI